MKPMDNGIFNKVINICKFIIGRVEDYLSYIYAITLPKTDITEEYELINAWGQLLLQIICPSTEEFQHNNWHF